MNRIINKLLEVDDVCIVEKGSRSKVTFTVLFREGKYYFTYIYLDNNKPKICTPLGHTNCDIVVKRAKGWYKNVLDKILEIGIFESEDVDHVDLSILKVRGMSSVGVKSFIDGVTLTEEVIQTLVSNMFNKEC